MAGKPLRWRTSTMLCLLVVVAAALSGAKANHTRVQRAAIAAAAHRFQVTLVLNTLSNKSELNSCFGVVL
jgi:hypothetical protein